MQARYKWLRFKSSISLFFRSNAFLKWIPIATDVFFDMFPPILIFGCVVIVAWSLIVRNNPELSQTQYISTADIDDILTAVKSTMVFLLTMTLTAAVAARSTAFEKYLTACKNLKAFATTYFHTITQEKVFTDENMKIFNILPFLPLMLKHQLRDSFLLTYLNLQDEKFKTFIQQEDADKGPSLLKIKDFTYKLKDLKVKTEVNLLEVRKPRYHLETFVLDTIFNELPISIKFEKCVDLWLQYINSTTSLGDFREYRTARPIKAIIFIGMSIIIFLTPFKQLSDGASEQTSKSDVWILLTTIISFYFTFGLYTAANKLRNPFQSSDGQYTVSHDAFVCTYRLLKIAKQLHFKHSGNLKSQTYSHFRIRSCV